MSEVDQDGQAAGGVESRAQHNSIEPADPAAGKRPNARRLRVLLVDDHADTLRVMVRHLQSAGHFVRGSTDAAGALAWVAAEPFDVVVSDIGLPDTDGYTLMRQIRSCSDVPGIALSGYGMPDDLTRSLEAGFSRHLLKPIDLIDLEAALQRIPARRGS